MLWGVIHTDNWRLPAEYFQGCLRIGMGRWVVQWTFGARLDAASTLRYYHVLFHLLHPHSQNILDLSVNKNQTLHDYLLPSPNVDHRSTSSLDRMSRHCHLPATLERGCENFITDIPIRRIRKGIQLKDW